jgi:pSer/pThr/pTyr-binding forkhead associated (FHA) protein
VAVITDETQTLALGVVPDAPPLPRLVDRDRRRAAAHLPLLAPGRYLAVEDGDGLAVVPLREPVMRLGRGLSADLVLEEPAVSRRHAMLVRREGRTVVLDDRSENGVYVNGRRVQEAELRDGDMIVLGRVRLRFVEVEL